MNLLLINVFLKILKTKNQINKIEPAVDAVNTPADADLRNSSNIDFVNDVAAKNVEMTIDNIRTRSSVLSEMEANGEIKIVGGMYDIATGKVAYYE